MIARIVTTLVGAIVVFYGLIAALSPLPLGIPLIILGLVMIAAANPAARPLMRRMRRNWRWFDFLVRKAAHASPKRFREAFDDTDPNDLSETDKQQKENPA